MGKINGSQKRNPTTERSAGYARQRGNVRRVQEGRDGHSYPNSSPEFVQDGESQKTYSQRVFGENWSRGDIGRVESGDDGGVFSQFAENCLEQLADNEALIAMHEEAIAKLKDKNARIRGQLAITQELMQKLNDIDS